MVSTLLHDINNQKYTYKGDNMSYIYLTMTKCARIETLK